MRDVEADVVDDLSLGEVVGWVADESNALAFMGIDNYLSADEEDPHRITTITLDGTASDAVNSADGTYPLAREL